MENNSRQPILPPGQEPGQEGYMRHGRTRDGAVMTFDPSRKPERYILSSAVLTTEGQYWFRRVTVEHAMEWLNRGPAESYVGYQDTCNAFATIFNVKPTVRRSSVWFQIGDEALIFRLKFRPSDPDVKFTSRFIERNVEIALLTREA